MGFSGLLGNQQLKDNLQASMDKGAISHFYLISGPEGSGKKTLARLLAAAILCRGQQKPCLSCSACRKVMDDTHPDLITVTDPEHKTVAVKLIRQMRSEMFILPNEASKKIYLLPQELGIEGQNALLKILEEPPEHGVFILLSENPEALLPTVRSRCTHLFLQGLPENLLRRELEREFPQASQEDVTAALWRSGGFLGQAKAVLQNGAALPEQTIRFLQSYAAGDPLGLVQVLAPMEKWKRDRLIPILCQWAQLLQQALLCRSGLPVSEALARDVAARRNPRDIRTAIGHLQKTIEYAQGNVSPAAICGYLGWALR